MRIRGSRDGLLITLGDAPLAQLQEALSAELAEKESFLQGSRIALDLGDRSLAQPELAQLQELFAVRQLSLWAVLASADETLAAARALELGTRLPGSNTSLDGQARQAVTPAAAAVAGNSRESRDLDAPAMLLQRTLRSGHSVRHDGHVVVLGDVNPGAEVIAAGNVIVWGRLRGMVHAGAAGDESAVICALELSPTQLRIADHIAIPPEERREGELEPEQAAIQAGQIVARPWQSR